MQAYKTASALLCMKHWKFTKANCNINLLDITQSISIHLTMVLLVSLYNIHPFNSNSIKKKKKIYCYFLNEHPSA